MVTVILDDIRSTYNVGAIMRTLDGIGGGAVFCAGITPYPDLGDADDRSPVVRSSNTRAISKTALGAESALTINRVDDARSAISSLPTDTFIVALEQSDDSVDLFDLSPPVDRPIALVLGSETEGLDFAVLAMCDAVVELPMRGSKESLNVSVAAGIALYHLDRKRR